MDEIKSSFRRPARETPTQSPGWNLFNRNRNTWIDNVEKKVEERSTWGIWGINNDRENIVKTTTTWWSWTWNWMIWWIWYVTLFFLLVSPLIMLFITWSNALSWENNWLLFQVYNNLTYDSNSTFSTSDMVVQFLTGIFWTVAIIFILFPQFDLKPWLFNALLQAWKSYSILKNSNVKDTDKERYNTLIMKIIMYSIVFIWLAVVYYFLINSIVVSILNKNTTIIQLLWILVESLVIIVINTLALKGLSSIDPAPVKLGKDFEYDSGVTDEDKTKWWNSNWVFSAIIIIMVNVIALSLSQLALNSTVNNLNNTISWQWGWEVIEEFNN